MFFGTFSGPVHPGNFENSNFWYFEVIQYLRSRWSVASQVQHEENASNYLRLDDDAADYHQNEDD